MNEDENASYRNVRNAAEAALGGKFIALMFLLKKVLITERFTL